MTLQDPTPKKEAESVGSGKKRRAPPWRKVFLDALRSTGNATLAASTAGVHRTTAYNAKDD